MLRLDEPAEGRARRRIAFDRSRLMRWLLLTLVASPAAGQTPNQAPPVARQAAVNSGQSPASPAPPAVNPQRPGPRQAFRGVNGPGVNGPTAAGVAGTVQGMPVTPYPAAMPATSGRVPMARGSNPAATAGDRTLATPGMSGSGAAGPNGAPGLNAQPASYQPAPFGTGGSAAAPSSAGGLMSGLNPANWRLPKFKPPTMPNFRKLLPGQSDRERITGKKNDLVGDVKMTASRSWQKTKEVLNPQKLNPMNLFAAPEPPATTPAAAEKPGFFRSIFGPSEPKERVAEVNDFLRRQPPSR